MLIFNASIRKIFQSCQQPTALSKWKLGNSPRENFTDRQFRVNWWIRNEDTLRHVRQRYHNPHYLSSVNFDPALLQLSADVRTVVKDSTVLVIAVPSAFVKQPWRRCSRPTGKVKSRFRCQGLLPARIPLLNVYLKEQFGIPLENYFAVLGPCHAEEVAAENSLTSLFGELMSPALPPLRQIFSVDYINTIVNPDIIGVQYAAVLKTSMRWCGNRPWPDYGDNFLSVYIANAADEMAGFLKQAGRSISWFGEQEGEDPVTHRRLPNYAASVYLGDPRNLLLCFIAANRTFGNMIGKGYSVKAAQLEMNMVAEGYNAGQMYLPPQPNPGRPMTIADTIYRILWENVKAGKALNALNRCWSD